MRTLLRFSTAAAVTVIGLIAIALPAHGSTAASDSVGSPVGVTVTGPPNPSVGTSFKGQPLLGVSDYNGTPCVGFSYEVPLCVTQVGLGVTAR